MEKKDKQSRLALGRVGGNWALSWKKNHQTSPMKIVAIYCFPSEVLSLTLNIGSKRSFIDQYLQMGFSPWLLSLKHLTQASLKTLPSYCYPWLTEKSLFHLPPAKTMYVGVGWCGVVSGDPEDIHLPMDFGSRFLTNSVWSPTCRML